VIVVDASTLVDVLVGAGRSTERLAGEDLAAPFLLDAEVGSALRRLVRAGSLTAGRAETALDDLAELEIERHPHVGLVHRAWALRDNVTFYDALYVALSEALDVPLVTLDVRLAGAPGARARVEVLPTGD
jgi:predicted nucleic acid-binding protein